MTMDCETFREKLDAWIDGEISPEDMRALEEHARTCGECRAEMSRAEALKKMCEEMDREICVPLPAQAAWRQAVRAEARRKTAAAPRWIRGLTAAAAALVVLVAGTWNMRLNETVSTVPGPTISVASFGMEEGGQHMGDDRHARGVMPGGLQAAGSLQSDGASDQTADQASEPAGGGTMVLRFAERSIRSDDYDSDTLWLNDLVSEYDAYFEEHTETAASDDGLVGRTATAVVRVPTERLDDFLTELDQLGETVMKSERTEDVTGYADTQSRLNALNIQKEKLTDMLADAQTVEEMIAIDDQLAEVIASLEILEGEVRRWESQQSYSRVTLFISETVQAAPAAEKTLGGRMKDGFDESVLWLKAFGQDTLVVLAAAVPKLVVWVPGLTLAAVLIWFVARKVRAKR